MLTTFSGFGQTFFIALFSAEIRATFQLSHGGFGALYMLGTLASALALVWLGRLVDVFSIASVSVANCSALAFFCLLVPHIDSVWMLVLVLFGLRLLGQGMMAHTAMTAMGRWYAAERGRAVALTSLGTQVGEALFPAIVFITVLQLGWRMTWTLSAVVLLLFAMPVTYSLIRTERVQRNPRMVGVDDPDIRHWTQTEVLRDPLFWLVCAGVLAPAFIISSVFFHQIYIAELKNWSRAQLASAFPVLSCTTILVGLIAGSLIDRFSSHQLLPYLLLPLGFACVLISSSSSAFALYIYMVLLGMSYGFSTSIFGALWPEIYGTRYLGAVRSVSMAGLAVASALGPGITGWLIDIGIGFESQIAAMAIYCFLASVIMVPASVALLKRDHEEFIGVQAWSDQQPADNG